jgi:hypothetical protein
MNFLQPLTYLLAESEGVLARMNRLCLALIPSANREARFHCRFQGLW